MPVYVFATNPETGERRRFRPGRVPEGFTNISARRDEPEVEAPAPPAPAPEPEPDPFGDDE